MGRPVKRINPKHQGKWRAPSDSVPVRTAPVGLRVTVANGSHKHICPGDVVPIRYRGRQVDVTVTKARPGPRYFVCSPSINKNEEFEIGPDKLV